MSIAITVLYPRLDSGNDARLTVQFSVRETLDAAVDARGVRAAAGRGQDDSVRIVRQQIRAHRPRVQRDRPVGGHEQRAPVHDGHDQLSDQPGSGRFSEGGRVGTQTSERCVVVSIYYIPA